MTDIPVLLYLLRSDTTSLAWAKERMIEAADEIERLCEQLAYFGKLASEENERQSNRIDELRAALGGLILNVEERDHYEECFGEAAEMKIARKAYQAATTKAKERTNG